MSKLTRATALQLVAQAARGSLSDLGKLLSGMTKNELQGFNQALTASGIVLPGVKSLELNHATVIIAATIADAADHAGIFYVVNTSASGTAAHTVTLANGTWNGTNKIATLNAPAESLLVFFDGSGNGRIILNTGSVALSGT
jgi:hypothetical protein